MPFTYDRGDVADDYARYRGTHPSVLGGLIEGAAIGPASRVLEVGCGSGNYVRALQELTGCSAWGIDPSARMLDHARQGDGQIHWGVGRADDLPPQVRFDLIFSVDVIHHVDGTLAHMEATHDALGPGGALCIVTDSEWIIRHRQPLSTYFPETVPLDLERYPRITALRSEMAQAGFVAVRERQVEYACVLEDIEPYRAKAFSCLHLISETAFRHGLARMENDLRRGPITAVTRYLLLWGTKSQS